MSTMLTLPDGETWTQNKADSWSHRTLKQYILKRYGRPLPSSNGGLGVWGGWSSCWTQLGQNSSTHITIHYTYIYIYIRRPAERVFNYSTMEYSIRCDPHESQTPPARAKPNSFLFLFFLPGPLSLRGTLFLRRATASAECRMPVFRIQRPGRFIGETTILDLLQEMVHVIRWRSAKLINMIKQWLAGGPTIWPWLYPPMAWERKGHLSKAGTLRAWIKHQACLEIASSSRCKLYTEV